MKKITFALLAAAIALSGCTKENKETAPENGRKEKATLEIRLVTTEGNPTRSTGKNWKDAQITDLYIYVFNGDGSLDAYEEVEDPDQIQLDCTVGDNKTICAVANHNPGNVAGKAELEQKTSSLTDNDTGQFVMTGKNEGCSIAAGTTSVEVRISRHAAKISIDKLTNELKDLNLKTKPIVLKRISVINAATGKYPLFGGTYTPTDWCNKMKFVNGSETDSFTSDDLSNTKIALSASYFTPHTFYCYPNPTDSDSNGATWSPRKTRLVIETEIGEKTYYYPLTLEKVEANTHYHFKSLTITRKGSDSPDIPVNDEQAGFQLVVEPWEESDMGDQTI